MYVLQHILVGKVWKLQAVNSVCVNVCVCHSNKKDSVDEMPVERDGRSNSTTACITFQSRNLWSPHINRKQQDNSTGNKDNLNVSQQSGPKEQIFFPFYKGTMFCFYCESTKIEVNTLQFYSLTLILSTLIYSILVSAVLRKQFKWSCRCLMHFLTHT